MTVVNVYNSMMNFVNRVFVFSFEVWRNLIICIVGLILLIIWKLTVRLHCKHSRLEKLVESERLQRLGL